MIESSTISCFRLFQEDTICHSSEFMAPYVKDHTIIDKYFIPQTVGSQVWLYYVFDNITNRLHFERMLPKNIYNYLDRGLIKHLNEFKSYLNIDGVNIDKEDEEL